MGCLWSMVTVLLFLFASDLVNGFGFFFLPTNTRFIKPLEKNEFSSVANVPKWGNLLF